MNNKSTDSNEVIGFAVPRSMALALKGLALQRSTPAERVTLSEVLRDVLSEYILRHPEMLADEPAATATPTSTAPCEQPEQ